MGSPNAFGRWPAQWNYIISTIQAAIAAGAPMNGIKNVVRTRTPMTQLMPAIGVQYMGSRIARFGQRQRQSTARFSITVCCNVPFNPTTPDTASAAEALLAPFVNDGLGHGLEPILNTLEIMGGICITSILTEIVYDIVRSGPTEKSESIAYADFTLEVVDQVRA
jgi:hypothetical protein